MSRLSRIYALGRVTEERNRTLDQLLQPTTNNQEPTMYTNQTNDQLALYALKVTDGLYAIIDNLVNAIVCADTDECVGCGAVAVDRTTEHRPDCPFIEAWTAIDQHPSFESVADELRARFSVAS